MRKEEVVKIAGEYASRHGFDLTRYPTIQVVKETQDFLVLFDNPGGRPGDHFCVRVDRDTGVVKELVLGE